MCKMMYKLSKFLGMVGMMGGGGVGWGCGCRR